MKIRQTAMVGTLESSDVQITLSPSEGDVSVEIVSDVKKQFGEQIEATVRKVLADYNMTNVVVQVIDKGALDIVIKARMIAAVERALKLDEPRWEVL